uniref:Uncharacterized protein n=1 Tax=Sphaerodactylus townsendi TaxID=933632 RepID=A0ACB8G165_9SAUR
MEYHHQLRGVRGGAEHSKGGWKDKRKKYQIAGEEVGSRVSQEQPHLVVRRTGPLVGDVASVLRLRKTPRIMVETPGLRLPKGMLHNPFVLTEGKHVHINICQELPFLEICVGADLLKMSKEDFVQICGPADGIRLFNAIKGRNVRPKMTVYVCQEPEQNQSHLHQKRENGEGNLCVYHAIFLEELTTLELMEKIANLYSISPQQINRIYRQGPTGIHVLVSNEQEQPKLERTRKENSLIGTSLFLECSKEKQKHCDENKQALTVAAWPSDPMAGWSGVVA